jgi:NCAIR mutase (PurE)-related protein
METCLSQISNCDELIKSATKDLPAAKEACKTLKIDGNQTVKEQPTSGAGQMSLHLLPVLCLVFVFSI